MLAKVVIGTAVVVLSVISGAVVAFELFGGAARDSATPAFAAAPPTHVTVQAPTVQAPPQVLARTLEAKRARVVASDRVAPVAASESRVAAQPAARPDAVGTVSAPPVVAAPAAPPAAASAGATAYEPEAVPAKDLTFAKGYAQRRAAQQAAAAATAAKNKVAVTAENNVAAPTEQQFGRPALRRKPSVVAQTARNNERYGVYERFDGFARHETLAYGDNSRPVRRPNSGGWFDGLF
jgi:DNA polymerase-3 subunit gamma/tau